MANCANCGVVLVEGATECASCGAPVVAVMETGAAPGPAAPGGYQQAPPQYQQAPPQYQQAPPQYQQVPPAGGVPVSREADIEANKAMAVLSYLGILVLIPIFAAKQSPFARFHANQGLVLFLAAVAYGILSAIILAIVGAIVFSSYSGFGLYTALSLILNLGYIFFLVLAIMGIVNAVKGEEKRLPLIGNIQILK